MLARGYGFLRVKAVDAEQRTIRGIASTPAPDRAGDIIEPLGITYKNPVPLLLYHDTKKPIGQVTFQPPTRDGLLFEASLPLVAEAGSVRDRIEEAWTSIKTGLLAGLSIGFRGLEWAFLNDGDGIRFTKSEVLELSLVAIPANPQATIQQIKMLDVAASGPHLPGVSGLPRRRRTMTTAEQIKSFDETRTTKANAMAALMTAAGEKGETLSAAQTEEYDGLAAEVKALDAHLLRLRDLEKTQALSAQPVLVPAPFVPKPVAAPAVPVITVKANVPAGVPFVRYVCARIHCKGSYADAAQFAERWNDSTPEVALALKAAVAAGTATDPAWAGPLVPLANTLAQDFIALLRPNTIIGRIPNLRQVPFNTRVPVQTAGGLYGWVGEAKPKPATSLAFSAVTLTWAKAAGIVVITKELARLSNPSAEMVVRNDMIAGIGQFLDQQFIDPTVAAVANVHPASITNGAANAASVNDPLKDLNTLLGMMAGANVPLRGLTLIMSETNAVALGLARSSLGVPLFPGMTPTGGTLQGFNVVASQVAGNNVIMVQPDLVLFADDGGVSIDVSEEASLQMDTAPMSPPDATVVMQSLWQLNLVGLRAERFINWVRGITAAVMYLTAANYTVTTPALAEYAGPTAGAAHNKK